MNAAVCRQQQMIQVFDEKEREDIGETVSRNSVAEIATTSDHNNSQQEEQPKSFGGDRHSLYAAKPYLT